MGRGHINLWIRNNDCSPLLGCWKLDLKIYTCPGESITLIDPNIINYVHLADSPMATKSLNGDYITFQNPSITDPSINHLDINLPPGCYKINARVCHMNNEETNQAMVIVRCDDHICLNLLLPEVMNCGKGYLVPGLVRAMAINAAGQQNIPRHVVKAKIEFENVILGQDIYQFKGVVEEYVADIQGMGLSDYETQLNELNAIVNEMVQTA